MQLEALHAGRVTVGRRHDHGPDDDPITLGGDGKMCDPMSRPRRRLGRVDGIEGAQDDQIWPSVPIADRAVVVAQSELGLVQSQGSDQDVVDLGEPQGSGQSVGQGIGATDEDPPSVGAPMAEQVDPFGSRIGKSPGLTQQGEQFLDDLGWIAEMRCKVMQLGPRTGPVQPFQDGHLAGRQPTQDERLGADAKLDFVDATTQRWTARMQPGLAGPRRRIESRMRLRHAANLSQVLGCPRASSTGSGGGHAPP